MDSSVKSIRSTISMIDGILYTKFSVVTYARAPCVQSARKTITLSRSYLEPEKIGYCIHHEVHYTNIPVSFEERG